MATPLAWPAAPWFGHSSHFHVRLHCPTQSPNCVSQQAVPLAPVAAESWQAGLMIKAAP
ncbi:penicillin-insensitive murein endopeptidase [Oceanimonas sp. NS1]|nr:penicillin-insensitive murein endopeptidase [Oceanimonas sp. NS1]